MERRQEQRAEQWEYRAVLAVDIEKSSGRGNVPLLRNREALRSMLRSAFLCGGIDWEACRRTDLGDGLQVTAPAGTRKASLVHPLVQVLTDLLIAHNAAQEPRTRIRVRVALHAGEICLDPSGEVAGTPLETLARLLDAPAAREALAAAPWPVPLSLLMSQHFYEETVRQGYEGIEPDRFHRVGVAVKEYAAGAWLHVPGWTPPRPDPAPERPARRDRAEPVTSTMNVRAKGGGTVYANQNGDQHIRVTRRS
ncbi:hypothetical protein [Streptomyces sp. CRN 30]|uniref:hypothetical protein n=1 Tax=Streptomyces sp. CRN 30 TaxID=3075613 RepID=UPI002A81E6E1|nr:hypothetical protein [Streptomyces sp. CRN 30]